MIQLRTYLNLMSLDEQTAFADRCKTTIGYLRKAISKGERIGEKICMAIERESCGAVTCEMLRPDVNWLRWRDMVPKRNRRAKAA